MRQGYCQIPLSYVSPIEFSYRVDPSTALRIGLILVGEALHQVPIPCLPMRRLPPEIKKIATSLISEKKGPIFNFFWDLRKIDQPG